MKIKPDPKFERRLKHRILLYFLEVENLNYPTSSTIQHPTPNLHKIINAIHINYKGEILEVYANQIESTISGHTFHLVPHRIVYSILMQFIKNANLNVYDLNISSAQQDDAPDALSGAGDL